MIFNEAFWFFYLVGIVNGLSQTLQFAVVLNTLALFGLLIAVLNTIEYGSGDKDFQIAVKWSKRAAISLAIIITLLVAIPSKEALYAGAGQYAVEATEVNDTLIRLKKLVDQRIAEETEER